MLSIPTFGLGFLSGWIAGFASREMLAAARPMAKRAIRSGLAMVERGREVVAQLGENFSDLLAEARSELGRSKSEATVASEPTDMGESARVVGGRSSGA